MSGDGVLSSVVLKEEDVWEDEHGGNCVENGAGTSWVTFEMDVQPK